MEAHLLIADVPVTVRSDGTTASVFVGGEQVASREFDAPGPASRVVEATAEGIRNRVEAPIERGERALAGSPDSPMTALRDASVPTWTLDVFKAQASGDAAEAARVIGEQVRQVFESATATESFTGSATPVLEDVKRLVRALTENPKRTFVLSMWACGGCFLDRDPQQAYNRAAAGTYWMLVRNEDLDRAAASYGEKCGTPQRCLISEVLPWVKAHQNTLDSVRESVSASDVTTPSGRTRADQPDTEVVAGEGETHIVGDQALTEEEFQEFKARRRGGPTEATDEDDPGMTDFGFDFVSLPELLNRLWNRIQALGSG